jgi:hypothetical protein
VLALLGDADLGGDELAGNTGGVLHLQTDCLGRVDDMY